MRILSLGLDYCFFIRGVAKFGVGTTYILVGLLPLEPIHLLWSHVLVESLLLEVDKVCVLLCRVEHLKVIILLSRCLS